MGTVALILILMFAAVLFLWLLWRFPAFECIFELLSFVLVLMV